VLSPFSTVSGTQVPATTETGAALLMLKRKVPVTLPFLQMTSVEAPSPSGADPATSTPELPPRVMATVRATMRRVPNVTESHRSCCLRETSSVPTFDGSPHSQGPGATGHPPPTRVDAIRRNVIVRTERKALHLVRVAHAARPRPGRRRHPPGDVRGVVSGILTAHATEDPERGSLCLWPEGRSSWELLPSPFPGRARTPDGVPWLPLVTSVRCPLVNVATLIPRPREGVGRREPGRRGRPTQDRADAGKVEVGQVHSGDPTGDPGRHETTTGVPPVFTSGSARSEPSTSNP